MLNCGAPRRNICELQVYPRDCDCDCECIFCSVWENVCAYFVFERFIRCIALGVSFAVSFACGTVCEHCTLASLQYCGYQYCKQSNIASKRSCHDCVFAILRASEAICVLWNIAHECSQTLRYCFRCTIKSSYWILCNLAKQHTRTYALTTCRLTSAAEIVSTSVTTQRVCCV